MVRKQLYYTIYNKVNLVIIMSKLSDEDKAFEQKLKGKMGWKCSCSLDIVDGDSTLKAAGVQGLWKNF